MYELAISIVSTWFGISAGVLALGAAAALVLLPTLGIRVASVLAPCVLLFLVMGYVERLQSDLDAANAKAVIATDRADKAEAAAKVLATTAQANADSAKRLADDARAQAQAYAADAEIARSDVDRIELARQAAALAAEACKPVSDALKGRHPVTEDDELAPSLKAALEALKPKGKRK